MTDVACFCGCCYSFEGDGGACPRCGEYASIRPASKPDRQPARSRRDEADAGRLPVGAAARS